MRNIQGLRADATFRAVFSALPVPPTLPPDRVCAVVVTFNRAALLAGALGALRAQTRPPDAVFVIDNASTDETPTLLAERFPEVTVVRLDRNTGASGGFAEGVRRAHAAGYDWLWILDDDVEPEPGCLEELLAVAEESGRRVVAPHRIERDGTFVRAEAVLDEARQVYAAPECTARWCPIDVFTFEGPLIHRSVVDRVGVPNAAFFILADDFEYAIRIYQAFGPGASVLAARTAVHRQLPPAGGETVHSRVKGLLTGDDTVLLQPDAQHWKQAYYYRNRHLIWKRLGWGRRRLRHLALHAGYLVTDALAARRRGWDWRLRLGVNARALWLGLLGRDGVFLDPGDYHARRTARGTER